MKLFVILATAVGSFTLGLLFLSPAVKPASHAERTKRPAAGPVFHALSVDRALAKAKAEDKLVMIDFQADWCGACRMLEADTWSDPDVRGWLRSNVVAIKLNVDREPAVMSKHRVSGIPALVFLHPNGSEAGRLVGFRPPARFLRDAESLVSGGSWF
jgi:thiol:disulfide interchange protein